jgi:hypothetical protein
MVRSLVWMMTLRFISLDALRDYVRQDQADEAACRPNRDVVSTRRKRAYHPRRLTLSRGRATQYSQAPVNRTSAAGPEPR